MKTIKEILDPCANAIVRIERLNGNRHLIRSESFEINNKLCIQETVWEIDSNRFRGMRGGRLGLCDNNKVIEKK